MVIPRKIWISYTIRMNNISYIFLKRPPKKVQYYKEHSEKMMSNQTIENSRMSSGVISAAICLALLAGCAGASPVGVKSAFQPGQALLGKPAPDIELALTDGTIRRLSDYKGRVLFLDFGASW